MTRLRMAGIVLLLAVLGSNALGTDKGKVLLYGGAGQGRVVFDGRVHAAKGYTCNDCHLKLFATRKQALITMEDHSSNRSCFACHNGAIAFNSCDQCHRQLSEPSSSAHLVATAAYQSQPATPAGNALLTYEGATTISTNILPDATKLFEQRTGIKFGAIGGAGAKAGFIAARDGKVTFGGLASVLSAEEKSAMTASVVIGYDVMGVFVHGSNPVKSLSRAQVKDIFTGKLTNWKQLNGADLPITIYSENLHGGRATVQAFRSLALSGEPYGPVKELDDATDCIKAVESDRGGIAASSMSFAQPSVVALAIEGVAPARVNVRSGKYPFTRPLVLVTKQPLQGDVKAFLDFMLTPEAQAIVGNKFVPVK